jgi:hypothetical protein
MATAGAAETVRLRVAGADRLRRRREASRRLWRAAPLAAAACAAVAAGARWTGRSPLVPLVLLGISLATLAAYAYVARRDRVISDAAAVDIDRRAGLGGELRSASWFSAREISGPWVDFHLARAAERLEATDWPQMYPPIRAHRAKTATALLVIAALVLALPRGSRAAVHATGSGSGAAGLRGQADSDAGALPPELRKQIEELLKNAERGAAPGTGSALTAGEVRDLLAKLAQAKDLRNAKEAGRGPAADAKPMGPPGQELAALAERLKHAGEVSSLSPEVRDAMADAAEKLSEMGESQATSPRDPKDTVGAADAPQGDAAQARKDGGKEDASVQSVKDSSAGGGIGVIMMASDSPQGAQEAGLGLGGGSAGKTGAGRMPDVGAALRKETVEAYQDDAGEKATMDIRRKTERGTATVAYVSISPAAFEKGRATAPPAVPENRRAAVQTYFIRKQ